jgi:predicted nucleotidyltransferase
MKRIQAEQNTILLSLTGSRLYGIENEDSDYDYKGICIPSIDYFIGTKTFEQLDSFNEPTCVFPILTGTDSVIYNLKKFCHLATLNNPNILEVLYVDPKNYIVCSGAAKQLIAIRDSFLSQKVYYSYSGYAHAQIRKVDTHRKWLLKYKKDPNFFSVPPNPKDFGLDENPLRKEQLHAFLEFLYTLIKDAAQYHETTVELLEKIELKGLLKERKLPEEVLDCVQYYTRATNDFMTLLRGTQAYRTALQEYEAYQSWKNNRNSKRAEVEAKCGYDGKHLGHCYRLLQTGIEILSGEGIQPDRRLVGDAEYIKSIRNGNVDYDDVKQNVDALLLKLEEAKQNTRLPKTPNTKTIEQVQIDILKSSLGVK